MSVRETTPQPVGRAVLAVDVGGSHVKLLASGETERRRFRSGSKLTATAMAAGVLQHVGSWAYDVVSVGIPAQVKGGRVVHEPVNLGACWVGFDYELAFGKPTKSSTTLPCKRSGPTEAAACSFWASAPASARR